MVINMEKHKDYLTIEQQIALLRSRNLIISDDSYACEKLSELNYYRLSGYSLTLRNESNKFIKNARFEDIIDIYEGDQKVKSLLFKYLAKIEIALRTHIGYTLGAIHPLALNSSDTFRSEDHYNAFREQLKEAVRNNKTEPFVLHHQNKYGGLMPSWVVVELLSFGELSTLYSALNKDIKKNLVAEYYPGVKFDYLENWLEGLVILRNFCAHHKRLYNRGLIKTPSMTDAELKYYRETLKYDENAIGKRLFFRLVILCRLLPTREEQEKFINELNTIFINHKSLDLKKYAFPYNWEMHIRELNENFFK